MPSTYLMLCLTRKGFGETILGLRVADDLIAAGHQVFVVAYETIAPLLQESSYPHLLIGAHAAPLFELILQDVVQRLSPQAVILADYYNTVLYFVINFLKPDILDKLNVPLIGIDIWDARNTPANTDVHVVDSHQVFYWKEKLHHILPCPILHPDHESELCYNSLPSHVHVAPGARRRLRTRLHLPPETPVVLFSTAVWQHANFENHGPDERVLAKALPELVASYISEVGGHVRLLHVGPEPYELAAQLGDHYLWLPQCSSTHFDDLLAGCDLYLSANVSATTVARSMVLGIPVVVLRNSVAFNGPGDEYVAPFKINENTLAWLQHVAPLRRFHMWPLGYYDFLNPLIVDNPYLCALASVELLDAEAVVHCLSQLLFDPAARVRHIERQQEYIGLVRALPSPSQLVDSCIENVARCELLACNAPGIAGAGAMPHGN